MTDNNTLTGLDPAEFRVLLENSLKINGLDGFSGEEKVFSDFFRLTQMLLEFNSHTNITAITDPKELIISHYIDSLTIASLIPAGARVADIGCGGGFPTLPLAIVRPDIQICAIDSTAKKLSFVEAAARELRLVNVAPACIRAEAGAADPTLRQAFDFVTARAVSALPVLCELCLPYLKTGGIFCAMKGPRGTAELAESKNAISKLGGALSEVKRIFLAYPDGGDPLERQLIIIKKEHPTPPQYPRAYGKIKNKPL